MTCDLGIRVLVFVTSSPIEKEPYVEVDSVMELFLSCAGHRGVGEGACAQRVLAAAQMADYTISDLLG